MTNVLLATGKKKKVQALVNYYTDLQKSKKLDILSVRVTSKKALFWNYDELKLLFQTREGASGRAPEKLLRVLDSFVYKNDVLVLLEFKTPRLQDKMVKVKVLTICHAFVSRGVQVKVEQEEKRETEYRRYQFCSIQLKGPAGAINACKEELSRAGFCDKNTVIFLF